MGLVEYIRLCDHEGQSKTFPHLLHQIFGCTDEINAKFSGSGWTYNIKRMEEQAYLTDPPPLHATKITSLRAERACKIYDLAIESFDKEEASMFLQHCIGKGLVSGDPHDPEQIASWGWTRKFLVHNSPLFWNRETKKTFMDLYLTCVPQEESDCGWRRLYTTEELVQNLRDLVTEGKLDHPTPPWQSYLTINAVRVFEFFMVYYCLGWPGQGPQQWRYAMRYHHSGRSQGGVHPDQRPNKELVQFDESWLDNRFSHHMMNRMYRLSHIKEERILDRPLPDSDSE